MITSSPPESAHAVGRALRGAASAWVADLRDAWTFEPIRPPLPDRAAAPARRRLERRWLRAADAVVCVSRPAADDLASAPRDRAAADPQRLGPGPGRGRRRPTARRVDPGPGAGVARLHGPVRQLRARPRAPGARPGRAGPRRPRGRLAPGAGGRRAADRGRGRADAHRRLARPDRRRGHPRPPERAIALQRAADALLLLASPQRSQLLNFKLFEYLAAERPILALAAGTEAGRVVEELGGGRPWPPTTWRRSSRRCGGLVAGELSAARRRAPASAYSYPAVAERMARSPSGRWSWPAHPAQLDGHLSLT